jgi:predicted nucleic acid-binding protein
LAFDEDVDLDIATALARGVVVPALWPYEIANALTIAQRGGRITADQATAFIAVLESLDIEIASVTLVKLSALVSAAKRHQLTAYDASYLTLAQDGGLELATLDRRLAKAAEAAGIEVLGARD